MNALACAHGSGPCSHDGRHFLRAGRSHGRHVRGRDFFIFLRAPIESRMGIVQKIFYFHVPSAYAMYIGAAACFFGSMAYLVRPSDVADAIGRAGAEAAVAFGATFDNRPSWAPRLALLHVGSPPRPPFSAYPSTPRISSARVCRHGEAERRFAAALGVSALPISPSFTSAFKVGRPGTHGDHWSGQVWSIPT